MLFFRLGKKKMFQVQKSEINTMAVHQLAKVRFEQETSDKEEKKLDETLSEL